MKYSLCSLMCVEKELCSGKFEETMNRKNQSKCLQDMENSYQLKAAQGSYYSKHSYNQQTPTHLSHSFLLPKSIYSLKDRFLFITVIETKIIRNDEYYNAMVVLLRSCECGSLTGQLSTQVLVFVLVIEKAKWNFCSK